MDYITKEGMDLIQKRIRHLAEVERPQVIKRVAVARAQGDLSENAEYKAAKEMQRHIDKELDHLKTRSTHLKVIDPKTIPKDSVRFGALITVKELDSNRTVIYHLVGIDEVNFPEEHMEKVSIASPIGSSMIGKKPGDKVIIKAPMGERIFEILEIK
ncbi:MAG TPA: transcription elongation factor GreA [Candidatus Cloacimonadota bacterium]|nr:transcription elongation factor GreA [Candidatus Cloacimonadota bacterium]